MATFTDLLELLRKLDLDEGPGGSRRPPRDNVRAVQHALGAWLADEPFYLDCIELELLALEPRAERRPAMFRMRDRPLVVQMFYWWPGRVAPPHEHTAWTVTAVFFNHLQVTTYDWDVAYRERRLARKNVFTAEQGRAGHIYDRCIHNPSNHTHRDSMSMHLFNESDVPRIEREVGPIPGMSAPTSTAVADTATAAHTRQRQLRVLASAASQFRSPRATSILRSISAAGDPETQARVDQICWRARRAMQASQ
jgi:predicted metal-dependent enzyme (double-stranded beta helix superfamily)